MYCIKCGKKIDESSNFCEFCGEQLKNNHVFLNPKIQQGNNETSKEKKRYAGFWVRFAAYWVDMLFIFIIGILFFTLLESTANSISKDFLEVIFAVILIFYHTIFLTILSSTPGKSLFGLKVIDSNGRENIHFLKALVRTVSYLFSALPFDIGFLYIAFDRKYHQGWHDEIAKTYVVRKQYYFKK